MRSRLMLLLACIILLSPLIGCKDIAGTLKARFNKSTQGTTATSAGNFGNTAEEQAMINAVTDKYGDLCESGSPRILELMLCSSVVNYIPADKVLQYSSKTPKFYAWFIYDNFNEGTISIEWIYLDDNYSIGTSTSKTGKDFGRGSFTLEAPDGGWPLGKYRVKVNGKGVTETVDFQVISDSTMSIAILLPDGSVDLEGASSSSSTADSETNTVSDTSATSDTSSGSSPSSSSGGGDSSSTTSISWNAGTTSTPSSSGPGSSSYFAGSLGGTWSVNFNNYTGKMEFWVENGKYAGRLYLDAHGKWETLKNISCNSQTGAVSFYRDAGNQTYTGIIKDRDMSGTFTSSGTSYKWTATLTSFTTAATSSSSSSSSGQGVWHLKTYKYTPSPKNGIPQLERLMGGTCPGGCWYFTQTAGGGKGHFQISVVKENYERTQITQSNTIYFKWSDPPEYIRPGERPTMSFEKTAPNTWCTGQMGFPQFSSQLGFRTADGKTYAPFPIKETVQLNKEMPSGAKGQTMSMQIACDVAASPYYFLYTYEWQE